MSNRKLYLDERHFYLDKFKFSNGQFQISKYGLRITKLNFVSPGTKLRSSNFFRFLNTRKNTSTHPHIHKHIEQHNHKHMDKINLKRIHKHIASQESICPNWIDSSSRNQLIPQTQEEKASESFRVAPPIFYKIDYFSRSFDTTNRQVNTLAC